MPAKQSDQVIRDVETAFWDGMQSKDAAAVGRMTDGKCIIVAPCDRGE